MKNFQLVRPRRGVHYVYFNANPKKLETSDCVIRAFAIALDRSWYDIFDALTAISRENATVPDSDDCWKQFLACQPVEPVQTIRKRKHLYRDGDAFARAHAKGRYILTMANHLSVCVDGVIYDIWDCSDKMVYKAYKVVGSDV